MSCVQPLKHVLFRVTVSRFSNRGLERDATKLSTTNNIDCDKCESVTWHHRYDECLDKSRQVAHRIDKLSWRNLIRKDVQGAACIGMKRTLAVVSWHIMGEDMFGSARGTSACIAGRPYHYPTAAAASRGGCVIWG
eukprot:746286-Hanusia_phi.AAC.5